MVCAIQNMLGDFHAEVALLRGGPGWTRTSVMRIIRSHATYELRFHLAERAELESDTDASVRSAKPAVPGPSGFTLHIYLIC